MSSTRARLLLVDDQEEQARSTAEALRAIGLRVEAICDGPRRCE